MGLWAEAKIIAPDPKQVNIKKFVLDVLKDKYPDSIIVKSTYSKEQGVTIDIRTDCYLGDSFNTILTEIIRKLNQKHVGYFYIEVTKNWYNL